MLIMNGWLAMLAMKAFKITTLQSNIAKSTWQVFGTTHWLCNTKLHDNKSKRHIEKRTFVSQHFYREGRWCITKGSKGNDSRTKGYQTFGFRWKLHSATRSSADQNIFNHAKANTPFESFTKCKWNKHSVWPFENKKKQKNDIQFSSLNIFKQVSAHYTL